MTKFSTTELKRFHQDLNATIIYVTRDQREAVTMADKMAVMIESDQQRLHLFDGATQQALSAS